MVDEGRRWLVTGGKKGKPPLPERRPQRVEQARANPPLPERNPHRVAEEGARTRAEERARARAEERLPDNVHTVHVGDVRIDIVRSRHDVRNKVEELSDYTDAACFETFLNSESPYLHGDVGAHKLGDSLKTFGFDGQYKDVLEEVISRKPQPSLLGVDCPLSDVLINAEEHETEQRKNVGLALISIAGSLYVWEVARMILNKQKKISRRTMLTQAGAVALASYLNAGDVITKLGVAMDSALGKESISGRLLDTGVSIDIRLGYQKFILQLRNLVMAEKVLFVSELLRSREIAAPHIALFAGAGHDSGITEALQLPAEDRRNFISALIEEAGAFNPREGESEDIVGALCSVLTVPEALIVSGPSNGTLKDVQWGGKQHFLNPHIAKVCGGHAVE